MRGLRFVLLVTLLSTASSLHAQGQALSIDAFLQQVRSSHPTAKIAQLASAKAQQDLLSARGGFDPKLFSDLEQKQFGGKNYYMLSETGIKAPLWLGMELKSVYQYNSGLQLDPQNKLPKDGQMLLGLSVPLAQNLVIDQRRAALKQAKIQQVAGKAEGDAMLNDLLYAASKDFWNWTMAWQQLKILSQSTDIALQQYQFVVSGHQQGDKRAYDTIEAKLQWQDLSARLNMARLELNNQYLTLANYLWSDDGVPLRVDSTTIPMPLYSDQIMAENDSMQKVARSLLANHPELRKYKSELNRLEVERKFKFGKLLPKLDLQYNYLSKSAFDFTTSEPSTFAAAANYKWGFNFSMPFFLGKERADLQMTKIKISETKWKQALKETELNNKLSMYLNEQQTLQDQVRLYQGMVDGYRQLLEGERMLFSSGESTQYLVNSRQNKLLDAQIKLVECLTKYEKAKASVSWVVGNL